MATFTQNLLKKTGLSQPDNQEQSPQTTPAPMTPTPMPRLTEKKETIRAAPSKSIFGKAFDKLPSFVREGVETIKEGLFGDPVDKALRRQAEERGVKIPIVEKMIGEGLLPFLGRTKAEKVDITKNSLVKRGVEPERAEEVAIKDVFARGSLRGAPEYKAFEDLELSKEEKRGVRMSRLGQNIGAGLDAISFFPVGKISNVSKATLTNSLKIADNAGDVTKILSKVGIAEDVSQTYSPTLAKLKDETQISKALDNMQELMQTTKKTTPAKTPQIGDTRNIIPNNDIPYLHKYSIDDISQIKKNPPSDVAMRTMKDERQVPAIRKSGVYAPKEFELHNGRDITGLLGTRSFNLRDAAISWDNLPRTKLAKLGDVGPMEKLSFAADQADARMMEFGVEKAAKVRQLAKKYDVNLKNKTSDMQVTLAMHGLKNSDITKKGAREAIIDALKQSDVSDTAIANSINKLVKAANNKIPDNVSDMATELRRHFDGLINQANPVRQSLGKDVIPYRENYAPIMQETSFWSKMRPSSKTEISDNFDYIIPNAKKNPHALSRKAGAEDVEWRFSKLASRYHEAISRDIYDAPIIEQLKAVSSVIKEESPNMANLIERHIREARVGKPAQLDSFFGITEGTIKRAALNKLNLARTVSALAFNAVWIAFVQPASLIMTGARSGPINMAKGVFEFATNKESRKYINKLPTIVVKRKGMSVGSTGAGDIDKLGSTIVKGKLENVNDFLGKISDANEYFLTGSSVLAGRSKAQKIGLKGESVDMYADWMGGATQSRYNKTARPMISNNVLLRTTWPFQTYQFELYRYSKTLLGMTGGRPLEKTERLNQAILLLGGMYAYDAYLDKTIGRRLATEEVEIKGKEVSVPRAATFVPLAGNVVDNLADTVYRTVGARGPEDRPPSGHRAAGAIYSDVHTFLKSIDTFVRHGNTTKIRKEMVKWGMGFTGVGGASTVNRLVDGLIANAKGYQTSSTDKRLFKIEGIDKYLSPLVGPYSTRAGIEFIKEGNSLIVQDAKREKKKLDKLPRDEAAKEFDRLMGENPNLARTIIKLNENERNPILAQIRGLNNADKAEKINELFTELNREERRQEYNKLIKAGEISQDVTDKLADIEAKQEQASLGEKPDFGDGQERGDKSIISIVSLYAKAIGTDPITAFDRILAGESIKRVENGTIIIERMPFEESQQLRKERASASELKELKLDHTIPLQLGGSNKEDNLILVSDAEWEAYTPVENLLGDHLRNGTIKRKEAQRLIKGFKRGEIPLADIVEEYPPTGKGIFERFTKKEEPGEPEQPQEKFDANKYIDSFFQE